MKKTTEDMILEQLFHLTRKVDKMQENMATKEDIKAIRAEMATKEDLKNYATKDDIKNFVTNEKLEEEFSKQSKEIAQIFHNTFSTMEKREKEAEQRILGNVQKVTEQRILSKVQVELEKYANHKI